MKLAFDPQVFILQRHGGVSRYFVELHTALSKIHSVNSKIFAPFHFNAYLNSLASHPGLYIPWSTEIFDFNRRVRGLCYLLTNRMLTEFRPHILHETFYDVQLPWLGQYKTVTTIHDLTRERLMVDTGKIARKRASIQRADAIISVSHNTTKDLLGYYKVPEERVKTIYVGVSDFFRQPAKELLHAKIPRGPFILFVGHRDGYKNWKRLVRAFSNSSYLNDNFKLVCFGGNTFSRQEHNLLSEWKLESKVIQINGDDSILRSCYQNASCLVYPSEYEGFGSPLIEAMAGGCPVFASDAPALLESGGSAARFFSSQSVESIAITLEEGLSGAKSLELMITEGIKHSAQFTWENTASQTLNIYKNL